jgi:hypothetical protein
MESEVVRALRHTWGCLRELEIPAALMGGLAVSAWDYIRATEDVDLIVGTSDPDGLLRSLQERGYRPKRVPVLVTFDNERVLQLVYDRPGSYLDLPVDLFIADSEYHRQALARRVPFRLPSDGLELSLLACEDLILMKLLANRILDRRDVVGLIEANRDDLDFHYLKRWLEALRVRGVWDQCWHEAFPNDPQPEALTPTP